MPGLLVGLDLGTTHLKAAAFTPAGELKAIARLETPTARLPDGGAEYDPEALWEGAARCLREVLAQAPGQVLGVGVASMAEAGVLVGPDGRALHPVIAWFDPRTRPQAEALARQPGVAALYERTGLYLAPKHGLCKLLWLREHHPHLFGPGATWLSLAEWVAFRLTGERASCPTLAARTLAYDLTAGAWASDLIESVGLEPGLFPRLVPEGVAVGGVSAGAASLTGLPAGTPVALAGHDHPCAALGAGVAGQLELLDSTGTAEAVIGVVPRPVLTAAALESQIGQGPLPLPGLYGFQVGTSASGGSLEWLRRELFPDFEPTALIALAASAGPGPSGLLYLPHLAGGGPPAVEPRSRGALVGLTLGTTRAQVALAVLEGTCFELRRMVEALEVLAGEPFGRVVVTGGQARSELWVQLKANILGRPVAVLDEAEATLLGAALLGGVAGNAYPDPATAARSMKRPERLVFPQPRSSEDYNRVFEVYEALFPALRPLYKRLS